jgi:predicted O-methyltransferase YrrM
VHSPFIYRLITHVIRERAGYYRLDEIESLRKTLCLNKGLIRYPNSRTGALLFRLVVYFRSKHILQVGTSLGFSSLFLSSHRSELCCFALEPLAETAAVTQKICEHAGLTTVTVRAGHYANTLPGILHTMGTVDLLYLNGRYEQAERVQQIFTLCLPFLEDTAIIICEGLRQTSMRRFWKELRDHPKITATLDLFSLGIAFISPKLHKKNYVVHL